MGGMGRESTPGNQAVVPTILIAEDDKVVRAMVERMLARAGYHVVTADDGGEALEMIEERGNEIDLFLADVVLPKIPGHEVASFAVEHFRKMAVLFISGYPQDEKLTGRPRFPNSWFLAKPFTPEELLMTVRALVDTPPEGQSFGAEDGT
jgi:two-component system, cell cycle sensor histidine kinase and response regulator CckA